MRKALMAALALAVALASPAMAWNTKVHGVDGKYAVTVNLKLYYPNAYNDANPYTTNITNGSKAEDEGGAISRSNHFYSASDFKECIRIWLESARSYYGSNKAEAYYRIGKAMHRVEDGSCPYHKDYWYSSSSHIPYTQLDTDHDDNGANDHTQMDDLCGQSYTWHTNYGVYYWSNTTSSTTVASDAANGARANANSMYATMDTYLHNKQYVNAGSEGNKLIAKGRKYTAGMIRWMNQK